MREIENKRRKRKKQIKGPCQETNSQGPRKKKDYFKKRDASGDGASWGKVPAGKQKG
jgi:hypothetical protein